MKKEKLAVLVVYFLVATNATLIVYFQAPSLINNGVLNPYGLLISYF